MCLAKLTKNDNSAIWAMVKSNGGLVTRKLTSKNTHLIISKPKGSKYLKALEMISKGLKVYYI